MIRGHHSPSVVVIGNFDGVHTGHRAVLDEARADSPGLPLVVVTFWPHPMSVIRPDLAPPLLTSLDERIALLKAAGADEVRVVEFTEQVAQWTPEEFVDKIVRPLHPVRVVVGTNFRFGHRAAGDVTVLRRLGEESVGRPGYEVVALDLVGRDDGDTCSTLIRRALLAGEVAHAAEHLGRPFRFSGVVVMGDQRGRDLGFPTANLTVPHERAVPADGVYAGFVTRLDEHDSERWPAAISVGTNPTFDGVQRRVESYVLDRDDLELYGVPIAVDFVARLRGQVKFAGIGALIDQMEADVVQARQILTGD